MTTRALLAAGLLSLGLGTALAQDAPAEGEAAAPAPAPVTYKLGGTLVVKVLKDESTLAAGLSHNHAVKAVGWTGSMTWDAANPGACKVEVTVPVQKLEPDAPDSRRFAGLPAEEIDQVSAGQQEDIKKNIVAKGQLDAAGHPNMTFKSTGCELSGDTVNVKGNLTIKGKTKAVVVPMKGFSAGDTLSASGSFAVQGTDFGVEPYSAMFGQLKNDNTWTFIYKLSGKK